VRQKETVYGAILGDESSEGIGGKEVQVEQCQVEPGPHVHDISGRTQVERDIKTNRNANKCRKKKKDKNERRSKSKSNI
jgi:hypothetical protein